jgi:hypothetical protein
VLAQWLTEEPLARISHHFWEVQIPQNTWTDTAIEINVNQGSLASMAGQWVDVFDGDDNVISGWPRQI